MRASRVRALLGEGESLSQVELARQIAAEAHRGQFRRDGKTPYISHPEAVASSVEGEVEQAVAILHDVIEDTGVTAQELLDRGVDPEVVRVVELLTHAKGESYLDYILRVKGDPVATRIKVADIKHNSSTSSGNQLAKYNLAIYILTGQTEALFHTGVYVPNEVMKRVVGKTLRLRYTNHAINAAQDDRYGVIDLSKIQNPLRIEQDDIIEVERDDRTGGVVKVLIRKGYDAIRDVVLAVSGSGVPGEGVVRTVWFNQKDDTHGTLNTSRYATSG